MGRARASLAGRQRGATGQGGTGQGGIRQGAIGPAGRARTALCPGAGFVRRSSAGGPAARRPALLRSSLALIAGALILAGCEATAPAEVPRPVLRPEHLVHAGGLASPESRQLAEYYRKVQEGFLARGLLRSDGGGPDVPFDARDLVDDFIRIALYEEYVTRGGRIVARETPGRLRKWAEPVRVALYFGADIPPPRRRADQALVRTYLGRLARITGHPIGLVAADMPLAAPAPAPSANFHIFVISDPDRRALSGQLHDRLEGFGPAALRAVREMPASTFCLVLTQDADDDGRYDQAVAVIRAEHPDLMRKACYHEEIAQGLGLPNDSPRARPSIFNDDEEFGLLTTHDEMLLRMLYDPRMKPGMSPDEARRVAEIIARELMGGSS